MRSEKLWHWLAGGAVGVGVIVPIAAFSFVKSGLFNVAASHPHSELTEWITHDTMIHSVRRHAEGIALPADVSAAEVRGGFCLYETHCVACHGAAAIPREQWVAGMEPSPPYLLDATSRWTPAQLFWIAKNGIKMTGMPSWRNSLSDAQIWEVVGFIEAMRQLPPQTYAQWRSRHMCGGVRGPWPAPAPAPIRPLARAQPTAATGG